MYAAAKPLSWDSNDFHLTLRYILGTPLSHLSEMTRHICILHEYILNDNKLLRILSLYLELLWKILFTDQRQII